MKTTLFNGIHRRLGAKLIDFGGYEMPVQYSGILEEHRCVRQSVGVFDVSHMGEFFVSGPDALAFIQKVTINDASKLVPGKAQYSAFCYPDGGIVDDLLVYREEDRFMLVVNASNIQKDFEWVMAQRDSLKVEVTNASDDYSLLAVQGPKSPETLQKLTGVNLSEIPYYGFVRGTLAGIPMLISRTGYTGELGFELYASVTEAEAESLWAAIFDAGKESGIKPAGLGARDTLRLEMGFCLYGNDIDQTTNPLEAGLGWITKLNKGDFVGRSALLSIKEKGPERILIGFMMNEKAIPRHGYSVLAGGSSVGTVTSGTLSPTLDRGIGLAYIRKEYSVTGHALEIMIRDRAARAEIVSLPFIRK